MGKAGYFGRYDLNAAPHIKTYLFIPYVLSILLPFLSTISLSISKRNIMFLIHFPLTIFTGFLIIYHSLLNFMGFKPGLKVYGGSENIQ